MLLFTYKPMSVVEEFLRTTRTLFIGISLTCGQQSEGDYFADNTGHQMD